MRELGLINTWLGWYKANADRCLGQLKEKRITFTPLTNDDLVGLWLILPVGVSLAIVAFVSEHVYALIRTRF